MSLRNFWQNLWQNIKHPFQMFALYLGATTTDFLSSFNVPPGFAEQNPFARHSDGQFWPQHVLVQCSISTVEYIVVALGLYCGVRVLNKTLARFAAGLPFLYYGYLHLDAAFDNILIRVPHLFVHMPEFVIGFLR